MLLVLVMHTLTAPTTPRGTTWTVGLTMLMMEYAQHGARPSHGHNARRWRRSFWEGRPASVPEEAPVGAEGLGAEGEAQEPEEAEGKTVCGRGARRATRKVNRRQHHQPTLFRHRSPRR